MCQHPARMVTATSDPAVTEDPTCPCTNLNARPVNTSSRNSSWAKGTGRFPAPNVAATIPTDCSPPLACMVAEKAHPSAPWERAGAVAEPADFPELVNLTPRFGAYGPLVHTTTFQISLSGKGALPAPLPLFHPSPNPRFQKNGRAIGRHLSRKKDSAPLHRSAGLNLRPQARPASSAPGGGAFPTTACLSHPWSYLLASGRTGPEASAPAPRSSRPRPQGAAACRGFLRCTRESPMDHGLGAQVAVYRAHKRERRQ